MVAVCQVTCGVVCAPVVQGTPRSISQGNFVTGSNSESTPAMQAGSRVVLKQVPASHDKYRRSDEQKVCCDQQQSQRRSKFHETTRHDTTRRDTTTDDGRTTTDARRFYSKFRFSETNVFSVWVKTKMETGESSNDVTPKRSKPTRRNRQLKTSGSETIKNSRKRDIDISREPEMLSGFAITFNFRYPIRGSDIAGPRIELIRTLAREICGS